MKSFQHYREDSTSDTTASIGSAKGSSAAPDIENKMTGFKKRKLPSIRNVLSKLNKDRQDKKKPEGAGQPATDGPGGRPDRKPSPYRQKTQRDQGGALAKRPEEKGSMVARKTAAAKQPPQHKQITARPASTAMAGSRQRPAIRPGAEKKALPGRPERKALPPGQARIAPQPQRKALPPGRG